MSRKVLFSLVLALVLVLCAGAAMAADVWDGTKADAFAGGTGTKADPYKIETAEQLAHIADVSNKYFILMADIDLDNREWAPLSGVSGFNGNNHTISNLKINQPQKANIGFFSGISCKVNNLKFHNADVTGGSCVAVVSGRCGGSSALFENIKVTGSIKVSSTGAGDESKYARAGVIAGGWAYGSYVNCVVIGDDGSFVRYIGSGDGRYCGGIVGHADAVTKYENCWVENLKIGEGSGWLCGGLTGPGPGSAKVIGCTVKDVTVKANNSGGLFGWFFGSSSSVVEDCVVENLTMTETAGSGVFGGYADDPGVDLSSNYSIGNPDNLGNKKQNTAGKTAAAAITVNDSENSYMPKRMLFDSIEDAVEELGSEGGEITIFDDQVITDELPDNIKVDAKDDAVIIVTPSNGYIMTYPDSNKPHAGATFNGSSLGFRSQVPLFFNNESTFVGVSIFKDSKLFGKQPVYDVDYTVTEGSTVVTLSAAYLSALESGTYTIAITSNLNGKDITVDSAFTIPAYHVPQTGDESSIALWIALMVISTLAFMALGRKTRFN